MFIICCSWFSLMEACYHGQLECVKVVVARGASWKTRDHSGQWVWQWVTHWEYHLVAVGGVITAVLTTWL